MSRVDAEGSLANSEEFLAFCSSLSTRVEPIAGEARWQMGRHSCNLRGLWDTVLDLMTKPEYLIDEAILRAHMANQKRACYDLRVHPCAMDARSSGRDTG